MCSCCYRLSTSKLVRYVWFLRPREINLDHEACICVVCSFYRKPEMSLISKVVVSESVENGPVSELNFGIEDQELANSYGVLG